MTPAQKLAKKLKRSPRNQRSRPLECQLREHRKKLGLNQADVAKEVGISTSWYCELECGSEPTLVLATKLAGFFGVGINRIWPTLAK